MLHLLFYLVFVLLHLLSSLSLFITGNLLSQKCRVKTNNFFFFFSRYIRKHVLIFFRLLNLKWACFKFCLIAVLICYLYFIIYFRRHNVFGRLWRVSFLARFVAGCLELGKKWSLGCSMKIMLSVIVRWGVFNLYD